MIDNTQLRIYYSHPVTPTLHLISGWLLARLAFSPIRDVNFTGFVLLPGMVVSLVTMILIVKALNQSRLSISRSAFLIGISVDSIAFWLLRSRINASDIPMSSWSSTAFLLSFTLLIAILILLYFSKKVAFRKYLPGARIVVSQSKTVIFGIIPLLTILCFRLSHFALASLPNDSRSIIVGVYELHHGVIAAFIFAVVIVLLITRCLLLSTAVLVILSIVVGSLLDQWTYLSLKVVSDSAYSTPVSWIGAIIAALAFLIFVPRWNNDSNLYYENNKFRKLLSHRLRGFGEYEHTPTAMVHACKSRSRFLELDTRVTENGRIVISHGPNTGWAFSEQCPWKVVNEKSLSCITHLNAEPVLTLDHAIEIFSRAGNANQKLCIDIKDYGFEEKHLELVRRASIEDRVCFVSWMPQSLRKLAEIGFSGPLILSHHNLLRWRVMGRLIVKMFHKRKLAFKHFVILGKNTTSQPLEQYERGYQHALVCQEIPNSLVEILAKSGGGICIHRYLDCLQIRELCKTNALQLWIFSISNLLNYENYETDDGVDVVFCDDALLNK